MSFFSMVEAKLPAGFRFHPRDDELICDYLAPKLGINDHKLGFLSEGLIDVDLNKCEPWDLPDTARVGGKDWYFFTKRDRKYATGQRTNRATETGYWKATGKDRKVERKGVLVGLRKTLVFYRGRAPKGKKTEWVMHEYRIDSKDDSSQLACQEDWVLCRIFSKQKGNFIICKPKMNTRYNNDTSALLPQLTDSHIIASMQTQLAPNCGFGFEQVPCFSSFNPGPSPSPQTLRAPNWPPPVLPEREIFQDPIQCEDLLKAILFSQIHKPNLTEGSCGAHLAEMGLASCWNPFS
ncbi:hypothetical protein LUZ60_005103 [Juncus effusus]|nr:hypothetical protein LUZ60_005103 [Juncus effusus]